MEYTVEDSGVSDFVGKKQRKKAEEMYCSQLAIWRIRALLRGGVSPTWLYGYISSPYSYGVRDGIWASLSFPCVRIGGDGVPRGGLLVIRPLSSSGLSCSSHGFLSFSQEEESTTPKHQTPNTKHAGAVTLGISGFFSGRRDKERWRTDRDTVIILHLRTWIPSSFRQNLPRWCYLPLKHTRGDFTLRRYC